MDVKHTNSSPQPPCWLQPGSYGLRRNPVFRRAVNLSLSSSSHLLQARGTVGCILFYSARRHTLRGGAGEEAGMGVFIPGCCGRGWRASGTPMEHQPSSAASVLIQEYLKFQLFMCSCCGLMLTDTKTLPRFNFIKFLSPLWTASLSPISFKGNGVLKSLLSNSWATSYNLTLPPSQILGLCYHGNIS